MKERGIDDDNKEENVDKVGNEENENEVSDNDVTEDKDEGSLLGVLRMRREEGIKMRKRKNRTNRRKGKERELE